jgi:hypothetical protein
MYFRKPLLCTAFSLLLSAPASFAQGAGEGVLDFDCESNKVCRSTETHLPVRVLIRPQSNIFDDANDGANVIKGNLPAFVPWFVFEARDVDLTDSDNPAGWYHIGPSRRGPMGWIKAGDAILWNSALVVTYAPIAAVDDEERRSPVFMFDTLDRAKSLFDAPDPAGEIDTIASLVDAADVDALSERGVVSMEPRRFLDFDAKPYILPVVNFETLEIFEGEARYLRIAAAVPSTAEGDARGGSTFENKEYLDSAASELTTQGTDADELEIEIKFAIDMTGSMVPYINAVKSSVARLAERLSAERSLAGAVRFGLIGYTDQASQCRDCPFVVAKDFFPDGSVESAAFIDQVSRLGVGGGGDYPEAVFAGMKSAVEGSWSQNSLKFVVLIGDASSNNKGSDPSHSESAAQVRALAEASNAYVIAMHAKDLRAQGDWTPAQEQFTELARNPGQGLPAYVGFEVSPSTAETVFTKEVTNLVERFAGRLGSVREGDVAAAAPPSLTGAEPGEGDTTAVADAVFEAALITYLGSAAEAPRDITTWVVDIDPVDRATPTLETRLLIEKRELNDLVQTLDRILEAFARARSIDSDDFFKQLQATMTGAALDRDIDFASVKAISGSGLVPRWLEALPYKSQIMDLTAERFADMSADDRSQIEEAIDNKVEIYRDLLDQPDIWIALSERTPELEEVYPILLRDLP